MGFTFEQKPGTSAAPRSNTPSPRAPVPEEPFRARLAAGHRGDALERDADRTAEAMLRDDGPERAQPKVSPGGPLPTYGALPASVQDVVGSPGGQPLDAGVRAYFEPRLGHDFSRVRVHTDARASASAQALGTRAYTVSDNIVFRSGLYAPTTARGARLLAHELVHVVQQSSGPRASLPNAPLQADLDDGSAPAAETSASPQTDAREAAAALKSQIEARLKHANDVYKALEEEAQKTEREQMLSHWTQRKARTARTSKVNAQLEAQRDHILQLEKDLEAIASPQTPVRTLHQILLRQGAQVRVQDTTEFQPPEFQPEENQGQPQRGVTTRSSYQNGTLTTETSEDKRQFTQAGFEAGTSSSTETRNREGVKKTSESRTHGWNATEGLSFSHSTGASEETRTTKTEEAYKRGVQVTTSALTASLSGNVTHADGTKDAATVTRSYERGEGKLGTTNTVSASHTNADGAQVTLGATNKQGIIAGQEGVGLYKEQERSAEYKTASGLKVGAVGGLNANIKCNVSQKPESDPPLYLISLEVNLGAKGSGSLGYEKEGVGFKASGRGTAEASAKMVLSYQLPEAEAKAYLDRLQAASSGTAVGGREFAIIACGVSKGWPAAYDMFMGARAAMGSPESARDMAEGTKIDLSVQGKAGVSGSASYTAPLGSIGIEGGYEQSHTSGRILEKKDGKILFTASEGGGDTVSAGGSLGIGVVKGGVSGTWTDRASRGYQFMLDPADPNYAAMMAQLRGATSQAELDAFAQQYPKAVFSRTDVTGHEEGHRVSAGVNVWGIEASMGLNYGSSLEEQQKLDAEGKTTTQLTGTNTGGAEIKLYFLALTASSKEAAVASIDAEGNATLDVSQTESDPSMAKFRQYVLPWERPNTPDGLVATVAGGTAPTKLEQTRTEGRALDGDALGRLSGLAMSGNPADWMRACPSPRLRQDWAQARREVIASGGGPAAVAKALARFTGKTGHGRDDAIYAALRGSDGELMGGSHYEFPEQVASLKGDYDALVFGDPSRKVDEALQKLGVDKAREVAQAIIVKLNSLYAALQSAQDSFQSASAFGQMVGKITQRKSELQGKLRVLAGGKADVLTKEEWRQRYNDLLSDCQNMKNRETHIFNTLAATYEGSKPSTSELIEGGKLLQQLRDLHAQWGPLYEEMALIAGEQGFGKDIFWKYRPDRDRFNKALVGPPGESKLGPDTEVRQRKKAEAIRVAPRDPVGDSLKENEKKRIAQANDISGQLSSLRNRAWGAGNRLQGLIQQNRRPSAIEAHKQGMEKLQSGESYVKRLPKESSTQDVDAMTSYGHAAMEDFRRALELFQEGLALYPGGSKA
jgi:hypothetical protein